MLMEKDGRKISREDLLRSEKVTGNMKRLKRLLITVSLILALLSAAGCAAEGTGNSGWSDANGRTGINARDQEAAEDVSDKTEGPVVALAWTNIQTTYSYTSTITAIEDAGGTPVILDMVRSYDLEYDEQGRLVNACGEHGILSPEAAKKVKLNTWQNSNIEEVMEGINCVVFPGGVDLSPSLYYEEQEWHGVESDNVYYAERDVSDYLLMSYCLEKDIPVLAICRGMQLLSVVSGAEIAQDIPTWFEELDAAYNDEHRDPELKDFTTHQVEVSPGDSLLYQVTGKTVLENVPSWHHQAVSDIEGTRLTVTGTTDTNGVLLIEVVERRDKNFCLGVQFHPEVAVRRNVDGSPDAAAFMEYDTARAFFEAIIEAGQEYEYGREMDDAA